MSLGVSHGRPPPSNQPFWYGVVEITSKSNRDPSSDACSSATTMNRIGDRPQTSSAAVAGTHSHIRCVCGLVQYHGEWPPGTIRNHWQAGRSGEWPVGKLRTHGYMERASGAPVLPLMSPALSLVMQCEFRGESPHAGSACCGPQGHSADHLQELGRTNPTRRGDLPALVRHAQVRV